MSCDCEISSALLVLVPGGVSLIKRMGMLVGNFENNPEILRSCFEAGFWAWLEMFFTSVSYQFQNTTLSSVIIFRLNALKETVKAQLRTL